MSDEDHTIYIVETEIWNGYTCGCCSNEYSDYEEFDNEEDALEYARSLPQERVPEKPYFVGVYKRIDLSDKL